MIFAAILGAVLVGVSLGLLGSGGSILTVPTLVYLVSRPKETAIIEALAIVGVIALSGAINRWRKGEVDLRIAVGFALTSIPGAIVGTVIGTMMPGEWQLVVLAVLMFTAAGVMYRGSRKPSANAAVAESAPRSHPLLILPVGAGVGMLTGIAGIGGGFMFVPALTVAGGLTIQRAIGTSLLLIFINCATGLTSYLSRPHPGDAPVAWGIVALFAGLGIAGAMAGQRLGSKLSQRALKRTFAVFLVIVGAYMLVRESNALRAAPPDAAAPTQATN